MSAHTRVSGPAAPTRNQAVRRHRLLILIPVALMALTACNNGNRGEESAPPAPTVTVTTTPSEEPTDSLPTDPPTTDPTDPPTTGPTTGPTTAPTTGAPQDLANAPLPSSYAEAEQLVQGGPDPIYVSSFTSPSGNIYCSGLSAVSACEIAEGASDSPQCTDMAPLVGRVELTGTEAISVCNTDTIRNGDPMALGYGERAIVDAPVGGEGPAMDCVSLKSGVVCIDSASQSGFALARGTFAIYN